MNRRTITAGPITFDVPDSEVLWDYHDPAGAPRPGYDPNRIEYETFGPAAEDACQSAVEAVVEAVTTGIIQPLDVNEVMGPVRAALDDAFPRSGLLDTEPGANMAEQIRRRLHDAGYRVDHIDRYAWT